MTMELSTNLLLLIATSESKIEQPYFKNALDNLMSKAHKSFMSYPFELDPCECGELCCNMGETCSPCREAYN